MQQQQQPRPRGTDWFASTVLALTLLALLAQVGAIVATAAR
jgi:hypothetical protein